jgi:hypothetical protein
MKRVLVALAFGLAACGALAPSKLAPPVAPSDAGRSIAGFGPGSQWTPIRIATQSIPLSSGEDQRDRLGGLVYRGGLQLLSDDPRFGGLSGLYVDGDGRLLAVSDAGQWFAARLVLDAGGELTGLVDAQVAALRDANGAELEPKREADSEEVTRLADGRFAVSFEQTHMVRLYDLAKFGPAAPASAEIKPGGTGDLRDNESFEAMTAYGDQLLLGAEEGALGVGAPFWMVSLGVGARAGPVGRVTVEDRFGLTGFARLPDGDVLSLERFYAPLIGPRVIVRRLKGAGLKETPARLDGPVLASFGPGLNLDNFEGIAVAPTRQNAPTRIYIVSDDNFRREQRTLLMAFDLAADAP